MYLRFLVFMKKEFFFNIFILIVANLLIKPLYILWIDIKVQNIVGPNTYGLYLSLLSICFIFQIIADPGILNYNTTFISSNRQRLKERFGVMLGLKLTLAILFLLAIAIFSKIMHYNPFMVGLIKYVALNVVLLSMLLYLRSNVSSLGYYRWDSMFSILDKFLVILFSCYLIYFYSGRAQFTIYWFVWAQTAAYLVSILLVLGFTHLKAVKLDLRFDFKYFKKILKKSLPFAWLLFLMTMYTRVDAFMLERLLPDNGYQAGVYASAFRFFDAGNAFASLLGVLLLPMFSYMISKNVKVEINGLIKSGSQLIWVFGVCGIIACCVWSDEIMQTFYPAYYTPSYGTVFRLLIIGLLPLSLGYIFGTALTAKKELSKLNTMAFLGVIFNIILNYFLILNRGAEGAAMATLVTQTLMIIIQIYFVVQIFDFKMRAPFLMRALLYLAFSLSISFLIKEYSFLHFWINFVFAIIISIFAALLLNILPWDSLKSIMLKKVAKK